MDPHCMFGCPVDSIHRGKHLQIVIEDHCIGCGLCADNCPYGSIFIMPNHHRQIDVPDPANPNQSIRIAQPRAVTCDLCDAHGEQKLPAPRCVAACPHEAASRKTGEELFGLLTPAKSRR
jgi:Fe-S-cluster-containing hydrogenase component 2